VFDVPHAFPQLGDKDLDVSRINFALMRRTPPAGFKQQVEVQRIELAPNKVAASLEDIVAISQIGPGKEMKPALRRATRSLQVQTAHDLLGSVLDFKEQDDEDLSDFDGQDETLDKLQSIVRSAQRQFLNPDPLSKSPPNAQGVLAHTIALPRPFVPIICGPKMMTLGVISKKSNTIIQEVGGAQSDPALFTISSAKLDDIDMARELIFQLAEG
jgi:hypothetical protein